MNREFLKSIEGLTDEAIEKIMAEHGKDIQKEQKDVETLKADLKTAKNTITTMTTELNTLKDSNASAEDWKKKFEDLQTETAKKEKEAKEAQAKVEKEAAILNRYNAVCVTHDGKPLEFAHEAIKADYLRKFTEAIESPDYTGKSDTEIFHALTKDDTTAFKGVQSTVLFGGNPGNGMFKNKSSDELSKMGMAEYIAARKEMEG